MAEAGSDWSRLEVEAIVDDYLQMLALEFAGQKYSKLEHVRALAPRLPGRSPKAIEYKYRNVSAVLIELGHLPIPGLKSLANYQRLLFEVVANRLEADLALDSAAIAAVQRIAIGPTNMNFRKMLVAAPIRADERVAKSPTQEGIEPWELRATRRDYAEREATNRSLGYAGEKLVLDFERWRLVESGRTDLADRIELVSKTRGDGLGFDILSFDDNANELLIEVKTTSFARETPFFVTQREREISSRESERFMLMRVFDFRRDPKVFNLQGAIAKHCHLDPQSYRAAFF